MAFYPTHTAYVTLHTHIYRLYILVSRIYKQDFNTNRSWPDISRHRVLPIIEPGNCLHLFCIFRLPVAELRYIAQQCCINIFLRSISIKSVDKLNILKKYNEKWGGGSMFTPLSYACAVNLTFLHIECKFSPVDSNLMSVVFVLIYQLLH